MLHSKPYLRISPRHDAHLGVATLSREIFLTSKKNREFYKRQRLVFQQQHRLRVQTFAIVKDHPLSLTEQPGPCHYYTFVILDHQNFVQNRSIRPKTRKMKKFSCLFTSQTSAIA